MGMDIDLTTTVLIDIDDFKAFFNSAKLASAFASYCWIHKHGLMTSLSNNGKILLHACEEDEEAESVQDKGQIEQRLADIKSGKALFLLVKDLVLANQHGSVGKYEDTYIENEELLLELLNLYLRAWNYYSGLRVPQVAGIYTFGSGRNCDWAVDKYGHPYLAFSEDDVFERRLTPEGADLQKTLGVEISTTTFSTVSY